MKPLVSGNAEIASAPTIPAAAVSGMDWNKPPTSVHLRLPPVMYITDPALINNKAL